MKVAIYARVSTERQAERGTVGSQLAALRHQVSASGHELISEFIDDGTPGARLDRPGLDALRMPPRRVSSRPYGATRRTGWPASSATRCSRPPDGSRSTTPNGARAGPSPGSGC
jgi:hypothetical protein